MLKLLIYLKPNYITETKPFYNQEQNPNNNDYSTPFFTLINNPNKHINEDTTADFDKHVIKKILQEQL